MSNYERLTEKNATYITNDGEHDIIVKVSVDGSEEPLYDLEEICKKLNRLAELEDKLKNGQLVENCSFDYRIIGEVYWCVYIDDNLNTSVEECQVAGFYDDRILVVCYTKNDEILWLTKDRIYDTYEEAEAELAKLNRSNEEGNKNEWI